MPRAKQPLKSDLRRQDLADMLGVTVEEILGGDAAAEFLGLTRKQLARLGSSGPMVYRDSGFGKFGIMFYTQTDLAIWRDDKTKWAAQNKAAGGSTWSWPTAPVVKPGAADTIEFLDRIINRADFGNDDKEVAAYKDRVLGRIPFPPPTPEEMMPEPARSKATSGWRSKSLRSSGA